MADAGLAFGCSQVTKATRKDYSTMIFSNMLWRLAERSGAQLISFLVSIILARLLLPEDYGVVSLIIVITGILNQLIDGGLSTALIQKQNTDQTDYSTVFYFNLGAGAVFYLGMVAAAPLIARFYGKMEMIPYIRVLSLSLLIGAFNVVQQALVAKRMQYKRFFFSSLGGTLVSAVVGVWMAFAGFGVWALIAQRLTDQLMDTVILWFTVQWRPSLCFSGARLWPLAQYGGKLLCSSLIYTGTNNFIMLLVGKVFSASELAYYQKGNQLPMVAVNNFQAIAQSVLFSAMAKQQSQREHVRSMQRKSVMIAAYSVFPCMVGLAVCAEPLVRLLFTEKWIAMVPYLQLWCLFCSTYLVDSANLQVIQALGRSDIFLKLEVIKGVLTVASLVIAFPFGVLPFLALLGLERPLHWYINAHPCQKLVGYGFRQQLVDLKQVIGLNLVMGAAVWALGFLPLGDVALLAVQVASGVGIYLAGSILLKLEPFEILLQQAKKILLGK